MRPYAHRLWPRGCCTTMGWGIQLFLLKLSPDQICTEHPWSEIAERLGLRNAPGHSPGRAASPRPTASGPAALTSEADARLHGARLHRARLHGARVTLPEAAGLPEAGVLEARGLRVTSTPRLQRAAIRRAVVRGTERDRGLGALDSRAGGSASLGSVLVGSVVVGSVVVGSVPVGSVPVGSVVTCGAEGGRVANGRVANRSGSSRSRESEPRAARTAAAGRAATGARELGGPPSFGCFPRKQTAFSASPSAIQAGPSSGPSRSAAIAARHVHRANRAAAWPSTAA